MIGVKVKTILYSESMIYPKLGEIIILEGVFKVSGDEGVMNLCILLGMLANQQDKEKIFFNKLVIIADKEDQATMIPFTYKSSDSLLEAYYSGCFRVIKHFQINQFKVDSLQAVKIATFLKDNPTLETLHFADNQLDHRVVTSILKKVYDNKVLKTINVASNYIYSDNQEEIMKKFSYHHNKTIIFA